ncbi:MAG: hypothetical protein HYR72_02175 [Deltaproteobacteria bacterium]|nr:hypothetical protein [Deltaproteobacteria bacterium]MBI3387475.1 hypothetical protein [Deltaproteobacteria bacterium]
MISSALRLSMVGLALMPSYIMAQPPPAPDPPKYRMELVYVFDGDKPEYLFVIGNSGFKSVASLKQFLATLPPGSTLEWAPGCERFGGEPLLSSEEDMAAFKSFCAEKQIRFILKPSG